jgi:hypothetical protein
VDRTALAEFSVEQENAGTVVFNFQGIPFLHKSHSHFTVTEVEVAGYPVDIESGNKKTRTRHIITAKAGTIIAESSI